MNLTLDLTTADSEGNVHIEAENIDQYEMASLLTAVAQALGKSEEE